MLPKMDPATGLLPLAANPYAATLPEVYERFVEEAPHRERRELIFRALEIYAELVWASFPDARLRIDGGFVTHKTWEPHDVDVVVICPTTSPAIREKAFSDGLFTMENVTGETRDGRIHTIDRLQPMGGLIDGFYVPETQLPVKLWFEDFWTRVTDQNKNVVPGIRKGYVEVINRGNP